MILCAVTALLGILISVTMLERQRQGLEISHVQVDDTAVQIMHLSDNKTGPLVLVAHGYAGSQQMMQPIAMALARSGFVVGTYDFHGHGRNPRIMSGDITSIKGTTARLVEQTIALGSGLRNLPWTSNRISLVGHSMATDVVIRAAVGLKDVDAVVAISMYSNAVIADDPKALLIISGEREQRLREVAIEKLHQVDPNAKEGETVRSVTVTRRAVTAPNMGHVGVLYSQTTLNEIRDWIAQQTNQSAKGVFPNTIPWLFVLLASVVALAWPLTGFLGPAVLINCPKGRQAIAALALPIAPALAAAYAMPEDVLGLSAFGTLTAFLASWGIVQVVVLWRSGWRPHPISGLGMVFVLFWGLCFFAPALDRYGAAFIPTGDRVAVMLLLTIGTLPFCLADAALTNGTTWVTWIGARLLPIAGLLLAMLMTPRLGIAFTVLPVLIFFWTVYGLVGRWVATRVGPTTSGIGLGIILAWAIAASTPMIAV